MSIVDKWMMNGMLRLRHIINNTNFYSTLLKPFTEQDWLECWAESDNMTPTWVETPPWSWSDNTGLIMMDPTSRELCVTTTLWTHPSWWTVEINKSSLHLDQIRIGLCIDKEEYLSRLIVVSFVTYRWRESINKSQVGDGKVLKKPYRYYTIEH